MEEVDIQRLGRWQENQKSGKLKAAEEKVRERPKAGRDAKGKSNEIRTYKCCLG